jgi:hypothetical protein
MKGTHAGLVAALVLPGCNASKPGGAGGKAAATAASAQDTGASAPARMPDTAVIRRYCEPSPGPAPASLTAMKDSAGYIGGYVFRRLILDSPVHYLDPKGEEVALFHVFGSPEEKRKNGPIIDALRAAYPVETPVECPPASTERPAGS